MDGLNYTLKSISLTDIKCFVTFHVLTKVFYISTMFDIKMFNVALKKNACFFFFGKRMGTVVNILSGSLLSIKK